MSIETQNLDEILASERDLRAPGWSADEYFTFFVTEQVLKNSGASGDDVVRSIVDGGNDCGIDAIMFLINDIPASHYNTLEELPSEVRLEMVLVQSKTSDTFQERPLMDMALSIPRLLNPERDEDALSLWCNAQLQERTYEFLQSLPFLKPKFPVAKATVYYATRGHHPHPKVVDRGSQVEAAIKTSGFFTQTAVKFIGSRDLLQYFRQKNKTTFSLQCATQPMASPDGNGYLALVRLPDYRRFVAHEDAGQLNTQLFEANVRDHEGVTDVNEAIQATLANSNATEDFWWLNNGVTVVVSNAIHNGHELTLESPQVVNGLQTSTEVWINTPAENDKRLILVRVIKAADAGVRDRIIQATNYQTAIPKGALRATDPMQRELEEWFLRHGIYYDRRRNYYANLSIPIDQIVSMVSLAEAVAACYLQEPHLSRSRGNQLMSLDFNYDRVFQSRRGEMYRNCLALVHAAREVVESQKAITTYYSADWYFHLACAATILLTRKERPGDSDIAKLDLSDIDTSRLSDLLPLVARNLAGPRSSILPLRKQAESPATTLKIVTAARDRLKNSRWREWPQTSVEDDFVAPSGRLNPDRRG